jgi:hypothetical protein
MRFLKGLLLNGLAAAFLAPCAALAQVSVSPASPRAQDAVRLLVPESGTFVYDYDSARITMADNVITVHMRYGGAISPPPPPSTIDLFLGQFPAGTYRVDAFRDDPGSTIALGSTSFTVTARPAGMAGGDLTDLWWNAAESGWGINIVQHPSGDLFATWFVYGPDGKPTWYVVPGGQWKDQWEYDGTVYRTRGPVLGAFDPAAVERIAVGTAQLFFNSHDSAALRITVDGQKIERALTRQPY